MTTLRSLIIIAIALALLIAAEPALALSPPTEHWMSTDVLCRGINTETGSTLQDAYASGVWTVLHEWYTPTGQRFLTQKDTYYGTGSFYSQQSWRPTGSSAAGTYSHYVTWSRNGSPATTRDRRVFAVMNCGVAAPVRVGT